MADNWFEKHPAKTIISHTLAVAIAAGGFAYFILDQNKEKSYNARIDSLNTTIETLKTRIGTLENDNKRYLDWLQKNPQSFPYLENRIKLLEEENKNLKLQLGSKVDSGATASTSSLRTYEIKRGGSITDPQSGITVGIADIMVLNQATITVTIPNKETATHERVKPGQGWEYDIQSARYQLIIAKVDYLSGQVDITIKLLESLIDLPQK